MIFLLFLLSGAQAETLDPIDVNARKLSQDERREHSLPFVRDISESLTDIPGVSSQGAGGISALPVIHGMADDRVNIEIDGAQITASCPNHMNPALSYVDPDGITKLEVLAGVTPVSAGGDSLGGSIIVKTNTVKFSDKKEPTQTLKLRSFYRSNNENMGASLRYSVASEKNFAGYQGLDEKANNYRTGTGKRLKATLFNRNSHSLTLGRKVRNGEVSLKYQHTIIPYEGFVNQLMDMTNNSSNHVTGNYKDSAGRFAWEASVSYQHTNHMMDVIRTQRTGDMPMYTRSDEAGYDLKVMYELSEKHLVTFGSEFNRYRVNDWWPGLPGVTMIMGPGEFQSIDNGKRDRLGIFLEADSEWTSDVSTNFGIRTDIVSMNTGDVRGYNETDNLPVDAEDFNSRSRSKTDNNYDFTLASKANLTPKFDVQLALARKSRSPNIYERYAWAGTVTDPTNPMDMSSMSAGMDMTMINWFGDGNGYAGNVNLKPEVAHKVSTSFILHDEDRKHWDVRLTPYYSEVQGFIDADLIGRSMGTSYLRFANHDAVVFGADFSATRKLSQTLFKMSASYTRGYRKDGRADLYHLMPLNGTATITHELGPWNFELAGRFAGQKKQVNDLRNEPTTPGYGILDVGTGYRFLKNLRLQLGVRNVFDHQYALPLGGVDLVNRSGNERKPVQAMGRSYDVSATFEL